jgi:hypothetical protein
MLRGMTSTRVVHFEEVAPFIEYLEAHKGSPRLIMLDHDLGGKPPMYYGQFCDPEDTRTGSEAARQMVQKSLVSQDSLCIIHSENPIGVQSLLQILGGKSDLAVVPFRSLQRFLDKLKSEF